ncbi:hypothetical protein [Actinoallomurus acanthiterrae]
MDALHERFTSAPNEGPMSGWPYAEPRGGRRRWVIVALCCAFTVAGIAVAVLFLLSVAPAGALDGHGMG